MIIVASLLSMAAFMVAFKLSGIMGIALDSISSAKSATAVMTDKSLGDEEKEVLLQKSSLLLFKQFARLTFWGVVILAAPMLLLLAMDVLGLAPYEQVIDFLLKWEVILAATVIALIVGYLRK